MHLEYYFQSGYQILYYYWHRIARSDAYGQGARCILLYVNTYPHAPLEAQHIFGIFLAVSSLIWLVHLLGMPCNLGPNDHPHFYCIVGKNIFSVFYYVILVESLLYYSYWLLLYRLKC